MIKVKDKEKLTSSKRKNDSPITRIIADLFKTREDRKQ